MTREQCNKALMYNINNINRQYSYVTISKDKLKHEILTENFQHYSIGASFLSEFMIELQLYFQECNIKYEYTKNDIDYNIYDFTIVDDFITYLQRVIIVHQEGSSNVFIDNELVVFETLTNDNQLRDLLINYFVTLLYFKFIDTFNLWSIFHIIDWRCSFDDNNKIKYEL